jgi:hypothetical protein
MRRECYGVEKRTKEGMCALSWIHMCSNRQMQESSLECVKIIL